jgi:nitrite reductase/ring-hydroxylating ferredoxin subunit
MIYIDERKARIAGKVAAMDAICEHADRLKASELAALSCRIDRLHRNHKAAIANRSGKLIRSAF